jgi:hypothetical protein
MILKSRGRPKGPTPMFAHQCARLGAAALKAIAQERQARSLRKRRREQSQHTLCQPTNTTTYEQYSSIRRDKPQHRPRARVVSQDLQDAEGLSLTRADGKRHIHSTCTYDRATAGSEIPLSVEIICDARRFGRLSVLACRLQWPCD